MGVCAVGVCPGGFSSSYSSSNTVQGSVLLPHYRWLFCLVIVNNSILPNASNEQ